MTNKSYNREYYKRNREFLLNRVRDYRKKNKKFISRRRRALYLKNKSIILKRNFEYRKENKIRLLEQKRVYRLRKMGLSETEIEKAKVALRGHNGICIMCKAKKPGGMGGWLIDHDHKNKIFRGILCNRCNTLIGFAKDNVMILQAGILYLNGGPLATET